MTLRADVRTLLLGVSALGSRVFDDDPPEGTTFPYAQVREDLFLTPDLHGDGKAQAIHRGFQVDLWEALGAADETLRLAMFRVLDGAKLSGGTRLSVTSAPRVPDPDADVAHTAFTVERRQPR